MKLYDVYPLFDINIVKGQGCKVWDDKGQEYLDLYGGHAVISIGHCHPHYVEMLTNQLNNLGFYSNSVINKLQVKLAERLGKASGYEDYQFFLINSGADVSVSVDINQDVNDGGVRVSLTLQAIEIATGNTLATKSEISGRKRTTADVLCGVMAQAMVGDFMKQISTRMATKISTGQSVAVRFTIDPGSAINMDTEINNIMPLSDILVSWVKRHAKNGKYHTQGRTSTLLAFSDIFVDNSMEDGMQSDVNDFALALYQYLKGLNLSVSRTITGNSIDVIIY